MKMKKLAASLAAVGFGLTLAGSANAAISWFFPFTQFQDDDLDYVVDNDQSGTLSTGDRLVSVIEFVNTQGDFSGQGPNNIGPGVELTAVADITIATVLSLGGGNVQYVFAPSGAAGVLSGFAAGTAVAAWTDATPDLDVINANCGTRAACLGLAGLGGTDGSALWATFGFFGDPDALWVSSPVAGGGTIATVEGGAPGQNFGNFNLSLQLGVNNTGMNLQEQACAPFCGVGGDGQIHLVGSGNILGGRNLNHNEWTARSDADVGLRILPEPGSLALVGAGLAAAGLLRRRKTAGK